MANINFFLNFLFFPAVQSFIAVPKTLSLSLLTQHRVKMVLMRVKLSHKCSTINLGYFFLNQKLACYWDAALKTLLVLVSLFETIYVGIR